MKRKSARARKQKSHTLEYAVYALLLIVTVWVVYSFVQTPPSPPQSTIVREGSPAPDFTLPIIDENGLTRNTLTLSKFRGKVVLLEFMVSSCPHCRNMAPIVKNLQQEYGLQNVVILTVAGTWNGADAASTAQFIQNYGTHWFHVFDQKNSVFNSYGVSGTPSYFIIDPDGIVKFRFEGEQSYATLAQAIDRVLKP